MGKNVPALQDCRHSTRSWCDAVWGRLKTETKEEREGEGFHCGKGKSGGSQGAVVSMGERKEGRS